MPHASQRVFWTILIALLLLTRLPAAARYLSIDNVNLALALENFDPLNHQPQPPGYPFFVGFARIVNVFFGDAENTFLFISVLATALCLPLTVALGRRLFDQRSANAAALLLLLNPVFWQTGLDGPLRPFLALFSLSTAYCAWRAWQGDGRFVLWGAASLGVGSGFRPDLLAYLGPVWLASALAGTRSPAKMIQGGAVLAGVMMVWLGALAYAVGGPGVLYGLTADYLVDQSRVESVLLGAEEQGAMRQLSRLVTWNALAVVGWVWAIPFALVQPFKERFRSVQTQMMFMAVWLVPGLVFQALVHVAAPGHTLFSIPALCLLGGWIIWEAATRLAPKDPSAVANASIAAVIALNILLFLNYFPLPSAPAVPGFLHSVRNAAAFATYETSIGLVRSLDDVAAVTMKELEELKDGRPFVIVTTDVHEKDWFMNWRILRYYAPDAEIWVTAGQLQPRQAYRVIRDRTLQTVSGDSVQIPIQKGSRLIWLLEPNGLFHRELAGVQKFEARRQLLFTDVTEDAKPFTVASFTFVPEERRGIQ